MKNTRFTTKALALILTLVMLGSTLIALPTSAIDINEEPLPDFLWELDFNKMTDAFDNRGSTDYTLEGKNIKILEAHGKKALGDVNGSCQYFINDVNNLLNKYDTFSMEADMYFEAYPSGEAGGKTPYEYPMSFMTWITQGNSGSPSYRSIRIDNEGYLCTGTDVVNKPEQRTSAKLPLGEWFNIRFLISPLTGFCEVYINGQLLMSHKIGSPKELAKSQVRFFDARYEYSAYFSNISVYTDSNYRIGLTEEEAADFAGFQTTKVENNSFDLRLVSGTNIADITTYNSVGFMVTTLMEENGEAVAKESKHYDINVYESLLADGKSVTAESLGAKYLAAVSVKDIPTNKGHIEMIIRPYVKKGGVRAYGEAIILTYSGEEKNGYPVLYMVDNSVEYTALPSDDTYVRLGTDEINGLNTNLVIKESGQNNSYTREVYIKFDFSDVAIKRASSASRIYLEFYSKSHRALSAEEQEEGGILADICGVDTNWTEDTLNGRNYKELASELEYIGDIRYVKNEYTQVDVTDYVLKYAKEGSVAFKIKNVEVETGGEGAIYSSESGYSPRLVVYPISYNHQINLSKLQNIGYEPWGYAETLVDEWFETGYDSLFSNAAYENKIENWKVDNGSSNGDYTLRIDWKSNYPSQKWNEKVYARSMETLEGFNPSATSEYDEFGGITNSGLKGQATGYFHTETIKGRTYIIDPLGNPFFSAGINTIQLGSTQNQKDAALEKYGSEENFYTEVADELRAMGINTYWGGDEPLFAQNKLARAIGLGVISGYMGGNSLNLSISTGGSAKFLHNNTMNVFDPDFLTYAEKKVATNLAPYGNDNPYILGLYSDNEIPAQSNMLYCYLTIDPTEPVNAFSYATAWTWFMKRTGNPNPSVNDITDEMSEEFKAFVYDRYFKGVTDAIKKAGFDNYMYMGNRVHSDNKSSEGYLRAAGKYLDVLTCNLYGGNNVQSIINNIEAMYRYSGKPFIVTEFFAKADDAVDMNGYSLGNQANAGMIVKTQADRAAYYEHYVMLLLESQTCVGWTWYRFRDNDQTIFVDEGGNLYRAYDYQNEQISGYVNVETGALIADGPAFAPSLKVFYKGEGDTSNLGSNKGFYDNKMNQYTELTAAVKRTTDNIFNLVWYFDDIHK